MERRSFLKGATLTGLAAGLAAGLVAAQPAASAIAATAQTKRPKNLERVQAGDVMSAEWANALVERPQPIGQRHHHGPRTTHK